MPIPNNTRRMGKTSAHYSGISLGIIGMPKNRSNFGIRGLNFSNQGSKFKLMVTCTQKIEWNNSMASLDTSRESRDFQLS